MRSTDTPPARVPSQRETHQCLTLTWGLTFPAETFLILYHKDSHPLLWLRSHLPWIPWVRIFTRPLAMPVHLGLSSWARGSLVCVSPEGRSLAWLLCVPRVIPYRTDSLYPVRYTGLGQGAGRGGGSHRVTPYFRGDTPLFSFFSSFSFFLLFFLVYLFPSTLTILILWFKIQAL